MTKDQNFTHEDSSLIDNLSDDAFSDSGILSVQTNAQSSKFNKLTKASSLESLTSKRLFIRSS